MRFPLFSLYPAFVSMSQQTMSPLANRTRVCHDQLRCHRLPPIMVSWSHSSRSYCIRKYPHRLSGLNLGSNLSHLVSSGHPKVDLNPNNTRHPVSNRQLKLDLNPSNAHHLGSNRHLKTKLGQYPRLPLFRTQEDRVLLFHGRNQLIGAAVSKSLFLMMMTLFSRTSKVESYNQFREA